MPLHKTIFHRMKTIRQPIPWDSFAANKKRYGEAQQLLLVAWIVSKLPLT